MFTRLFGVWVNKWVNIWGMWVNKWVNICVNFAPFCGLLTITVTL